MTQPSEPLLNAINEALDADTRLDIDALTIEQDADDGRITVEGVVDDVRMKRRAVNTAWSVVRGRHPITDHLRVRCQAQGEEELRDEVVRKIMGERLFAQHTLISRAGSDTEVMHDAGADAPRVEVTVAGGIVTLSGTVTSLTHRRFAEVLAWWAPGCERVDNLLEVVPPEDDNDNEITDAVRMVLEKDPLVHATQLHIGTAGGIVALEGLVATDEERHLAEQDAWYVPGVWAVVDRVEVRP
ncbi:MAG: BON domain-containing protein [Pseudomonadota bacterium]